MICLGIFAGQTLKTAAAAAACHVATRFQGGGNVLNVRLMHRGAPPRNTACTYSQSLRGQT